MKGHIYAGLDRQLQHLGKSNFLSTEYDDFFHVTAVNYSDGSRAEQSWGSNCCGKESDKDAIGIERTYDYDLLGQLITTTKKGTNSPSGDVRSESTFDAEGRTLTTRVSGGSLSLVTSSNTYNLVDQIVSSVDSFGRVTTYAQTGGGRTNTVLQPCGLTNVTVSHLSGQSKYSTENGVIKSWQDYGVNADGTQWTITYTGPAGTNSPVWRKTTTDLHGRTIREERPGFSCVSSLQFVVTNSFSYNSKGQLVKTQVSGFSPQPAATLFEHNELGEQIRSGLDVDNNGVLDLASMDRISESETVIEKDVSNDYWRVSISKLYAQDNSSTVTTNNIQKTRLAGLNASKTFESISKDMLGNETVSTTSIDRNNKTVTQTVLYPDSTNSAASVSVNGLLVSSKSKTGLTTSFAFDGIERQIGVTDPRTGTSVTHYNDKGQIDWTEDAATNRTTFVYDSATGRRVSVTDALSNTVYTAYDVQGQQVATWGATYPVMYEFDDFNRMSAMYTYRGTNVISSYSDMCNLQSSMDRTTWLYDLATGLLTNKVYADGKGPAYTYTADGKLASRTWARGITTAYNYTNTGEMVGIDYSDSTPDVTFAVNRSGQQVTVTDAQGARAFTYNDFLQLAAETNAVGLLARTYDSLGRPSGLMLGSDYSVTYDYSDIGRFSSVSSSVQSVSSVSTYSYLPNSDLISQLTTDNGQLTITRGYELNRNLLTSIVNTAGANPISRFDYTSDEVGRRTQRIDSSSVTNVFGYNPRSELTAAAMGPNNYGYQYDLIGNRLVATNNAEVLNYRANALNQYTNITDGVTLAPTFDLDGNMTNCGTFAFAWDGENRLIGVESNGTAIASYKYDYMGRRYQKVAGLITNTFIYDGWAMIRELSAAATNSYVYGLDLSGSMQGAGTINGILWESVNGVVAFPAYDGNGNVTDLTDANGSSVAHYEYDPYGNTILKTGTVADANPFRFSTKYYDSESGLYYYGRRLYHSTLARWINRDPTEERGGRNLYNFGQNASVLYVDYLGLWSSLSSPNHSSLTADSWNSATLPASLRTCRAAKSELTDANEAVDSLWSTAASDLSQHYNREPNGDTAAARTAYTANLTSKTNTFYTKLQNTPTKQDCKDALKALGQVTHSWQDYYAHAIENSVVSGTAAPGDIQGDPDAPSTALKPASFVSIWNTAEHGISEPAARAGDGGSSRSKGARDFVEGKYETMLPEWWKKCQCVFKCY